ncbi:MAG: hypothetical protein E7162_01805 [Firmicutes bacterium]|nr:hypothetical protein [Bacillota bacterium]
MGTWGVNLYQDDVACDVKDEYLNLLKVGKSNEEATQFLISHNEDFVNDSDDKSVFWFALADTQWNYGRLLPLVKENAIMHIDNEEDLKRWKSDCKMFNKRKQVLLNLREKLILPQPLEKKVTKLVPKKTIWNVGDFLLYKICNDELIDSKWYNKYVLFKVIGFVEENIGNLPTEFSHKYDVVVLCNFVGDDKNVNDIIKLNTFYKNIALTDIKYVFSFNRTDLKKLDFKIIYKSKLKDNFVDYLIKENYISYPNVYNLDFCLVHNLDSLHSCDL